MRVARKQLCCGRSRRCSSRNETKSRSASCCRCSGHSLTLASSTCRRGGRSSQSRPYSTQFYSRLVSPESTSNCRVRSLYLPPFVRNTKEPFQPQPLNKSLLRYPMYRCSSHNETEHAHYCILEIKIINDQNAKILRNSQIRFIRILNWRQIYYSFYLYILYSIEYLYYFLISKP